MPWLLVHSVALHVRLRSSVTRKRASAFAEVSAATCTEESEYCCENTNVILVGQKIGNPQQIRWIQAF
jgi:hypothetical protein